MGSNPNLAALRAREMPAFVHGTSPAMRLVDSIMRELGIAGLAICYTGALTCRLNADPHVPAEVVTDQRMNLSSARKVLSNALELGISVGWFIGDFWYISAWDSALQHESMITGVTPIVAPDLMHFKEAPHKLQAIVGEPALLPRLYALEKTLPPDCVGQFSYETYLEIIHQGVDKATALLSLGKQLGISPSEMVAIGDMQNDVAMLRMAAQGIVLDLVEEKILAEQLEEFSFPAIVKHAADVLGDRRCQR